MLEHTAKLEGACKEFEDDFVLYYYGDGLAADRPRVEDHVKLCPGCCRFLDDLSKILPHMAQPKELPKSFWDDYYRELLGKLELERERKPWWRTFYEPARFWIVPAFGTAAVAVFALALIFGNGDWGMVRKQPAVKVPKDVLADTNQLEFFKSMDILESLPQLEAQEGSKMTPAESHNG